MHVALLVCSERWVTVASLIQAATDSCVSDVQTVSQPERNSTKECIAIVLESTVVTFNVSTVKGDIVAVVIRDQCTGMSERLTVVHRVCMAVEEVASSLDNFVTDDGVEVTNLDRQVAITSFHVQLWKSGAILTTVVPAVVEIVGPSRVTEGLSVRSVSTVDVINASTQVEPTGSVDRLLSEQPTLLKLDFLRVFVEVDGGIGEITQLHPTTCSDAVTLAEQSVRVAQAAIAATQAIAKTAIAKAESATSGIATRVATAVTCVTVTSWLASANRLAAVAIRLTGNQLNIICLIGKDVTCVSSASNRGDQRQFGKLHLLY
jgi:hypothetical protein